MATGKIMGKSVKYPHNRRCDFCHKPVKHGYIVREGETHGFFCSSMCLKRATEAMRLIKKEKGIE